MEKDILTLLNESSYNALDFTFTAPDTYVIKGKNDGDGAYELLLIVDGKTLIITEKECALKKLSKVNRKALIPKLEKYGLEHYKGRLSITCDFDSLLFTYQTFCLALDIINENDVLEEAETQSNIELLKKTCGGLFKFRKYDEDRIKMSYSDFKFMCNILVTELEDDKTFMLTDDGTLTKHLEKIDSATLKERLAHIKKKYGVVYNNGLFMTIVPLKQVTSEYIELLQAITYVIKG